MPIVPSSKSGFDLCIGCLMNPLLPPQDLKPRFLYPISRVGVSCYSFTGAYCILLPSRRQWVDFIIFRTASA